MVSILRSPPFGGGGGGGSLRCSFCGRRDDAVDHLVRARSAYICDRCVALAHEAIAPGLTSPVRPIVGLVATEDDVRRIALSLPETFEKPWFGTPGFRVKDKGFLRIRSEAEGGLVVWVSDLGEKEALLASEPEKFFTTPHYDGHPTVLVNLPAVDVDELRELITESWLIRAPKRVRQAHEDEVVGDA